MILCYGILWFLIVQPDDLSQTSGRSNQLDGLGDGDGTLTAPEFLICCERLMGPSKAGLGEGWRVKGGVLADLSNTENPPIFNR